MIEDKRRSYVFALFFVEKKTTIIRCLFKEICRKKSQSQLFERDKECLIITKDMDWVRALGEDVPFRSKENWAKIPDELCMIQLVSST